MSTTLADISRRLSHPQPFITAIMRELGHFIKNFQFFGAIPPMPKGVEGFPCANFL